MPPTAPPPGTAPPGAAGAALSGARDAAGRLPATGRGGGHRRQRWRHRARRPRAARPGQHRAASAVAPGRRLRAAADVTGAAVLLAGLPWGWAGWPAPRCPGTGPAGSRCGSLLASPLSGGTAVTVLAGAAWLLWAVFAAAVIAEVTAAACGRPVPRLPAIAPVQALAAALAGTVVLTALHLPRTAARAAHPPHAAAGAVTTACPARARRRQPRAARAAAPAGHRRFPGNAGDRPQTFRLDAARAGRTSGRARADGRVHTVVAGDNPVGPGPRLPRQRRPLAPDLRPQPRPAAARRGHPHRPRPDLPRMGPADPRRRPAPAARRRTPARWPPCPAPPRAGTRPTASPGPARTPHPPRSTPAAARPGARAACPPGRGTAAVRGADRAGNRRRGQRRRRPGPPPPPAPLPARPGAHLQPRTRRPAAPGHLRAGPRGPRPRRRDGPARRHQPG